MTWWKTGNSGPFAAQAGYVNAQRVERLDALSYEGDSGTVWVIAAIAGAASYHLTGTYASEADALEVARQLCQGFDPTTLTDT